MNHNQTKATVHNKESVKSRERVGWVGLGHMGIPMAKNILKAGFPLHIYNRNRERMAEINATPAESPSALAKAVDIVVTMLSDDAALEQVIFGPEGLAQGLRAGMLLINMGTHSPEISKVLPKRLAALGVQVLDAPVSGSVQPAIDSKLVIVAGGEAEAYERARPLFEALGKRSFYFGAHGQGACAKLSINMLLGLTLQALGEAVVLGEKSGLNRDLLLDMISETACASPIINAKIPSVRAGKFPAAFPLKHMEKDFGLAVNLGSKEGAHLPLTNIAANTFSQAKAHGLGDEDIMGILRELMMVSEKN